MIQPLIFSKDRPAQLDLLLRSIAVNGDGVFGQPTVLAKWSDHRFYRGYEECLGEHSVEFVPEYDFEWQVRRFLDSKPETGFFVALCDDNVLYRHLESFHAADHFVADPVATLNANDDVLCFSLRLGENTMHCYPHARQQALPPMTPFGDVLMWDWRSGDGDLSYPGSLDGHVLRVADVIEALDGRSFTNPNQMEDALVAGLRDSPRPRMASYFLSALVGNPINRTTQTHQTNRIADFPGCGLEEMNERYLAGERLSLSMIDAAKVDGAHCEFAPVWELPLGRRGSRILEKARRESGVSS